MNEFKKFNIINKKLSLRHSQSSHLIQTKKKSDLFNSTLKVKVLDVVKPKKQTVKLNLKNLESENINKQISVLSKKHSDISKEKNIQNNDIHDRSSSNNQAEVKEESKREYLFSNRLELENSNENDMEEEKIRDEVQVKKLNFWEMQNFVSNCKAGSEKSQASQNVSRCESISYIKEVKERIENQHLKKASHLQKLDKKNEEEQGTILMQNIKSTKKKFNFSVFFSQDKKNEEKSFKTKMLFFKDKKNEINVKVEGGYEALKSPNLYREIIKEKTRQENLHLMELMKTSQNIYEKKKHKYKLNTMISDCNNYLIKIKHIFTKEKDLLQAEKVEFERNFDKKISDMEFESSKSNSNKNKSVINVSEEIINLKHEFHRNVEVLNQKIEKTTRSYNHEKSKYVLQSMEHKKNKKDLEGEIKNLKNLYNTLAQEQIIYYNDILKRGIDVRYNSFNKRYEGLSWAVKRLIELNAHLDYSVFPRFLDHSQIDYLMKISYKLVESGQFKIMLKALKTKQKKLRHDENTDFMKNSKISFNSTNTSSFLFQGANNTARLNKTSFSNQTIQHFDKYFYIIVSVFQKYDKLMRLTYEQKIEDFNIQSIVDGLKEKMRNYKNDGKNNLDYQATSNIKVYFDENKKQKEYFEEILVLRQKIEELDKEINLMREEAIKCFKKKYDALKSLNNKFSIQYDMIYSALFGNL